MSAAADEKDFFTVVFKGDIRKLSGNPMRYVTLFGEVQATGVGDAFAEIDRLSALDTARSAEGESEWIATCTKKISNAVGGGSELFLRHGDGFRLDIDFVCKRISEIRERQHEAMHRAIKAERTLSAAPSSIAEKEEVAQPLHWFRSKDTHETVVREMAATRFGTFEAWGGGGCYLDGERLHKRTDQRSLDGAKAVAERHYADLCAALSEHGGENG